MSESTSRSRRRLASILDRYQTPPGHFDEILSEDRLLRAPWAEFAAHVALRPAGLTYAQARVARQMHENGVTYNVYAAADGPQRHWTLDVLPFILSGIEWDTLSRGLNQRARLMNALAADLYGDQAVLRHGLLPPALVLGHTGFLRMCHGVRPPGGVFLHLIAFDLARGPDGYWRVVATRTQGPSGAGYALENRAAVSRLFPEAFRALGVQAVAPFFGTVRQSLLSSAPSDGETPHVVLLTPGPYNETYFEHAFLAKHLGFPLVQGADLTVRHNRLFLKTVSGLRRVHAVMRRLDDAFCDPLELKADSTLGVPGLLQAWRTGNVLIANAFGMGVLESPALNPYLDGVCHALLGEPLAVASIKTQWCGETVGPAAPVTTGVVKAAFPEDSMEPVFLSRLSASSLAEWNARLSQNRAFVVQEFVPLSHAPIWHSGHLESRALMLRVFLVADGTGGYQIMPGGLSRIAGAEQEIVSGQRGGGSKDTWALATPVAAANPPPEHGVAVLQSVRDEQPTTSRAAEHLFWLGRYAERSENCARLARAALSRLGEASTLSNRMALYVGACRRHGMLGASQPAKLGEHGWLIESLFDRNCQSLGFNIDQTVRVAGAVRHQLSSDNWKVLNRLSELFPRLEEGAESAAEPPVDLDEALELIDRAIVWLVAVGGLEMAHMTRDDGWRFLTLGRHLERLWFVAATLEDVSAQAATGDPAALEWVLELSDSLITYRARHARAPEWQQVLDLLLLDSRNPRSGAFQLSKLAKHVRLLPDADLVALTAEIDRLVGVCGQEDTEQGELFEHTGRIVDLLEACLRLVPKVADILALRYFSHVYDEPHTTVMT
jgi:uncharacterized circularly permuted ATP-grasp superfamily protein/uncharacterized alpha-E superfamily protein